MVLFCMPCQVILVHGDTSTCIPADIGPREEKTSQSHAVRDITSHTEILPVPCSQCVRFPCTPMLFQVKHFHHLSQVVRSFPIYTAFMQACAGEILLHVSSIFTSCSCIYNFYFAGAKEQVCDIHCPYIQYTS